MKCFVCEKNIPVERVKYLEEEGINSVNFTCVQHSTTKKKKGLFEGEAGASRLIICDEIRDVNIRSIMKDDADSEHEHEDELE